MRFFSGFGTAVAILSLSATIACSKGGEGGGGQGGDTATSSGTATGGETTGTTTGTSTTTYTGGSLPSTAKTIYLHHSTGGVIWGGGVPEGLAAYNTAHGTSYAVEEQNYPDSPYPWQNYPYDYWHLWVEGGGQAATEGVPTLADLAKDRDVIVWKHCFPVSDIEADTGNPDIGSNTQTIENYKLQYAALKDRMRQMPDKRFLVWTGAARLLSESSTEAGARSRQFFTWVKTVWDEPGDNIFVWDFFELETEGGNFLVPANAAGDSHPSDAFAQTVAPYFVNRLVDVIEGRGDTGSLTGK